MTRETRKIQKVGGSTFSVSLPKSWARARALEAGSPVTVYAHPDDVLVVDPGEEDASTDRTVQVAHDDPDRLVALLRAGYAAGLDQLAIEATETLTRPQRRAVGRVTEELPGTAVVEEREARMVVRVLLDGEEVSVAQSVRQLAFVALAMHREVLQAATGDAADAVDRDAEADRLFALVDRHFQRGLSRIATLDGLDVARPELAALRDGARALQQVAADARRLGDLLGEVRAESAAESGAESGVDSPAASPAHPVALPADAAADLPELGRRAGEVVELATGAVAGDAGIEAAAAAIARHDELAAEIAATERDLLAADGDVLAARALEHCRRTAADGALIARVALQHALHRGDLATPVPAGSEAPPTGTLFGDDDAAPPDAVAPGARRDGEPAEGGVETEPADPVSDSDD